VLEIAARFPMGRRGQPGIVAGMDLTAGPGRPVREPDRLVGQVTTPLRGLPDHLGLVHGGQAVLLG
jgi:hypothetical protein